jgi:hypothetical protein
MGNLQQEAGWGQPSSPNRFILIPSMIKLTKRYLLSVGGDCSWQADFTMCQEHRP